MKVSTQPKIAPSYTSRLNQPGPGSPDPDGGDNYVPDATGDAHLKRIRCQRAIGTLTSVVGAGALATAGAMAGALAGFPIVGGIVGGLLGARLGYKGGFNLAARLHDNSDAKPLTNWQDPERTSPEQAAEFEQGITDLQHTLVDAGKNEKIERGFHEKQNWGGKAHLDFNPDLDPQLRADLLADVAGKSIKTAVRFSNGQGCPFADGKPDVRGVALKMDIGGREDDWLATNHVTFAHDAEQFMKFAAVSSEMQAKGPGAALKKLYHLIREKGYRIGESIRIFYNIVCDTAPPNKHVALESYWTQAQHIGKLTGRFVITPESGAVTKPPFFGKDKDFLRKGFEQDLEAGPIKMHVGFEAFTEDSPRKDAHQHGEHVTYDVGTLVFEQRKADSDERRLEEATVAKMAFNPVHGNNLAGPLNESNRGKIYAKSAENRGAIAFDSPEVQAFFASDEI